MYSAGIQGNRTPFGDSSNHLRNIHTGNADNGQQRLMPPIQIFTSNPLAQQPMKFPTFAHPNPWSPLASY